MKSGNAVQAPGKVVVSKPEPAAPPIGERIKYVKDLMTKRVRFVRPSTPLREVVALMQELRVRHMPVVDERRRLRGLISHRDLISGHFTLQAAETGVERNAGTLMTLELDTVKPDDCLHCAARLMFERKRGSLPVVDGAGRLVGILTEADFVRAFGQELGCQVEAAVPPGAAKR